MEYSVTIRTIGQNPYTERLLDSLIKQSLPPKEIDLVIPHNGTINKSWSDIYPNMRVINSSKGMISQRSTGIREARYRYILLLDDDIEFDDNKAIENLFSEMLQNKANMAIPYSSDAFPKGRVRLLHHIFGMAVPTSKRYLGYTPGGGYYYPKYPSFEQAYETEGGRGCCIAADRDFLLKYKLFGDPDLETLSYPLREDGAFVASVAQNGGKSILVGNISYTHLGVARKLSPQRLYNHYYASVFNNYVFWRKYVKSRYRQPILPYIAFEWHLIGIFVFALLVCMKYKSFNPIFGAIAGFMRIISRQGRNV